jgi:pimeloyl-ACP methyl ester carboxylesterase
VFLPGLTADHRLFDKQVAYFEGKNNVLVWDAPGHAASWPFSFTFVIFGFCSNICRHSRNMVVYSKSLSYRGDGFDYFTLSMEECIRAIISWVIFRERKWMQKL